MTPDEIKQRMEEYRQQALERFPLELVETTGDQALAKWQELKSAGQGSPVVLGGGLSKQTFDNLLAPFGPSGPDMPPLRSVEDILEAAARVVFPDDLAMRKKRDAEAALRQFTAGLAANPDMPLPRIIEIKNGQTRAYTREETIAEMMSEPHDPPLGEWPDSPSPSAGLSVAYDLLTGEPLPTVSIGLAPTDDWTTIPAYLRWGGWNDCPAAEYHVAALRTWRDRYGAELIGMNSDTMNLRVARRPATRDEALEIARVHYVYCSDIIDQGVGTYRVFAAGLMASDWWFFWWD